MMYAKAPWKLSRMGCSVSFADGGACRAEMAGERQRVQDTMRLVACAPELLDACRMALEYMRLTDSLEPPYDRQKTLAFITLELAIEHATNRLDSCVYRQ